MPAKVAKIKKSEMLALKYGKKNPDAWWKEIKEKYNLRSDRGHLINLQTLEIEEVE